MRVAVNLSWLVPGVVGGSEESTTRSLLGLAELGVADDVDLFVVPGFADAHPEIADRFRLHVSPADGGSKLRRVATEYAWLTRRIRAGFDVVHHAGGTAPGWTKAAVVVTIHDIQPLDLPEHFSRTKVAYLRAAVPAALRRADAVVVPSGFVRDRLVDRFGTDPGRIHIVPHPAPPAASPAPDAARRLGIGEPYVVLAGIPYPHKRHVLAVEAVARIDGLHLALPGGTGPAEAELTAAIERSGAADRIHRLGRIPAPDLHGLVADAAATLVPSIYEGFGLPALEAMALGSPVVVADAGALPEVVGSHGTVVAPDDVDAWSDAIRATLDTSRAHPEAAAHAATFTVERTAEGLLAAYQSAMVGR